MSRVRILDCTLRDGGYINDWRFGKCGIAKIIAQLTSANIDVVECGFLEDGAYDADCSLFTSVEQIRPFLPKERAGTKYVAMACYGEYALSQLTAYDGTSIDGIRVTFHYDEVDEAMEYCRQIMDKGYRVFVQPVGTTSYSDEQLLVLINKVNELNPYAFYFVDTLGLMQQKDVLRFFYLIDNNLRGNIKMGFHSHNNLQLSYSNCQALATLNSNREVFLDSSVYGMGRGAGNLNTELITSYLNQQQCGRFNIEPILEIVDEFIMAIKSKSEWGYCVPYYLAAINGCHPNYASYLNNKRTLTVRNIATILRMIEPQYRSLFDKTLIEQKYLEFQSNDIDDSNSIAKLQEYICGRNVLLLAPGSSLLQYEREIIASALRYNCVVISIAFIPDFIRPDFVFISNLRRYQTTFSTIGEEVQVVCTSNINGRADNDIVVNYASLLNDADVIRDNTAIILLNLLLKVGAQTVYLAGMDGYKTDADNYCNGQLNTDYNYERCVEINNAVSARISQLSKSIDIKFVTPSLYRIK